MTDASIYCICAIRALDGGAMPLSGDRLSAIWGADSRPHDTITHAAAKQPVLQCAKLRREIWPDKMEGDEELTGYL